MDLTNLLLMAGAALVMHLFDRSQLSSNPQIRSVLELIFRRFNVPVQEQVQYKQLAGVPVENKTAEEILVDLAAPVKDAAK